MSTNPPSAYSAVATGAEGQGDPAPAYNQVDVPLSHDNPSSDPVIQYPSLAHNPPTINPSAPAIQYVDQNGNPIQPTGNVRYVDQSGNSVAPAPPQSTANNIQYVDPYGNPVIPPQSTVQYVQARPPTMQYISTAQIPASVPVTPDGQTRDPANSNTTAAQSNAQGPSSGPSSCCYGSFSCWCGVCVAIVIAVGLLLNDLAHSPNWPMSCGWFGLKVRFLSLIFTPYAELCDDYKDWCSTQTAGIIALICCITSGVYALCGVGMCSRRNKGRRRCGRERNMYIASSVFGILALISWLWVDDICLPATGGMVLGNSMICVIVASVLAFIAAVVAHATPK